MELKQILKEFEEVFPGLEDVWHIVEEAEVDR